MEFMGRAGEYAERSGRVAKEYEDTERTGKHEGSFHDQTLKNMEELEGLAALMRAVKALTADYQS